MIHDIMIDIFDSHNKPFVMKALSIWHILYLFLIIVLTVLFSLKLHNKPKEKVEKALKIMASLILGLYILDFFAMPLSSGTIYIDKLPFHFCTVAGILIFLTRFNQKLTKYRDCVTVLGIVGTLMYIVYPSSAFTNSPSPFSYQVLQTFSFHGLLLINGVVSLTTGDTKLSFKKFYEIVCLIIIVMLWGAFANAVYSHGTQQFDWCFIRGLYFPALPGNWMILGVFFAFSASSALIYLIYYLIERKLTKQNN